MNLSKCHHGFYNILRKWLQMPFFMSQWCPLNLPKIDHTIELQNGKNCHTSLLLYSSIIFYTHSVLNGYADGRNLPMSFISQGRPWSQPFWGKMVVVPLHDGKALLCYAYCHVLDHFLHGPSSGGQAMVVQGLLDNLCLFFCSLGIPSILLCIALHFYLKLLIIYHHFSFILS